LASLPGACGSRERECGIAAGEVAESGELPAADDERGVLVGRVEPELPSALGGLPPAKRPTLARTSGTLTSHLLGVGLDALTLAATVLTVVVVDDDLFLRQFGAAGRLNEEGELVSTGGGQPVEGLPFTGAVVERLLSSEPMASPGAACLALAWRHRDTLLGQ